MECCYRYDEVRACVLYVCCGVCVPCAPCVYVVCVCVCVRARVPCVCVLTAPPLHACVCLLPLGTWPAHGGGERSNQSNNRFFFFFLRVVVVVIGLMVDGPVPAYCYLAFAKSKDCLGGKMERSAAGGEFSVVEAKRNWSAAEWSGVEWSGVEWSGVDAGRSEGAPNLPCRTIPRSIDWPAEGKTINIKKSSFTIYHSLRDAETARHVRNNKRSIFRNAMR
jgi:hypothetical protein